MKTAVYIEEGIVQLVLTPETEFEKTLLARAVPEEVHILRGSFYGCQGGWTRMSQVSRSPWDNPADDHSLIVRLAKEVDTPATV